MTRLDERSRVNDSELTMTRPLPTALLLLAVTTWLTCSSSSDPSGLHYAYRVPPQVDDGWETASLASVGMDAGRLIRLMDTLLEAEEHRIHGVLVVKDGKLVFEEYFSGYKFSLAQQGEYIVFDRDTLHNLASVTKSITSALVGIALDRGSIASLNERAFTYFPEYADLSGGGKNEIRLEHLITMTSGLQWDEETYWYPDPRNDIVQLFLVDDPIRFVLAKPLVAEPGTQFHYSGGCTNVLGEIVSKAAFTGLDDFSEQFLFTPLGVTDFEWQYLPGGVVFASGDLRLRPRDMAKFGYMYLSRGTWGEARVLSQNWIDVSTSRHIPLDWGWTDGYGYGWWTQTYATAGGAVETYFAAGWGGQQISVVPELDMVVVFTGGGYYEDPLLSPDEMMRDYVLPAAR